MSFEEFWGVYPRRVAKLTAKKAYNRALKCATHQEIISGAEVYAKSREGQDIKFTKHPSTWLNGGCWEDEKQDNKNAQSVVEALDRLAETLSRSDGDQSSEDDILCVPQRQLRRP